MKIVRPALSIMILAGLVAGIVYLNGHEENASGMPPGIFSCNGRLEVKRVDVASLYAGRVESVAVDRGQTVSTGDVLVTLSSSVAASQLKSASARRDMVQENLRKNDARITQINEEIRLASIELNDAEHLFKDYSEINQFPRTCASDNADAVSGYSCIFFKLCRFFSSFGFFRSSAIR